MRRSISYQSCVIISDIIGPVSLHGQACVSKPYIYGKDMHKLLRYKIILSLY